MAGEDPGLTVLNNRLEVVGACSPGVAIRRMWLCGSKLVLLTADHGVELVAFSN
jgi:hypothetical protein